MIFFVSVLFIWAFYVVPLRSIILTREPVFPALGAEGSWLLAAILVYSLMALAALTVTKFEDVLWPSLPAWREKLLRRTGIDRIDDFGRRLSLLAVLLFAGIDITLLPLGAAAFLGFWSLSRREATVRKVETEVDADGPEAAAAKASSAGRSEDAIVRIFEWTVPESHGAAIANRVELPINESRYREFARTNPANFSGSGTRGFAHLIKDGTTGEVNILAGAIREISKERGLSSYQEISLVLAFVQALPNEPDQEAGRRYIRWPIETLYENLGSPDCKSVLLAAVLKVLGYEIVIIESDGRTAVGVGGAEGIPGHFLKFRGANYYYCEPTVSGSGVGQAPADLAGQRLWVYKIDDR